MSPNLPMEQVSVVIPTFNRASTVMQAVESALSQTHKPLEVIVVDDGSTDQTPDLFSSQRPGTKYLRIPHSGLPAVTRNAGARAAKGEFVAFIDSDDKWKPNHLHTQLEQLRGNQDVSFACANALLASSGKSLLLNLKEGTKSFCELVRCNFVVLSSVVARRHALQTVGGFDEAPHFRAYEDYELWLRMALKSNIQYSSQPSIIYSDRSSDSVRGAPDAHNDCLMLIKVFLSVIRYAERDKSPKLASARQAVIEAHERLIYSRGEKSRERRFIAKLQLLCLKYLPKKIRIHLIQYLHA